MGRAEDRALKAYPIVISQYSDNCKEYDSNESDRLTFIEGYHQAEKDLELTWEDVKKIEILCFKVDRECDLEEKEHYQEVLKRFKDFKERKEV